MRELETSVSIVNVSQLYPAGSTVTYQAGPCSTVESPMVAEPLN